MGCNVAMKNRHVNLDELSTKYVLRIKCIRNLCMTKISSLINMHRNAFLPARSSQEGDEAYIPYLNCYEKLCAGCHSGAVLGRLRSVSTLILIRRQEFRSY